MSDLIDHPSHYGGGDNPYETIKVIEAWQLGFHLGNAVKYISRAGKKQNNSTKQDLAKALWYLERYLDYADLTKENVELDDDNYEVTKVIHAWGLSPGLYHVINSIFLASHYVEDFKRERILARAVEYLKYAIKQAN